MMPRISILLALAAPFLCSIASAQTVLITGANRGIGLELARQYASDGWQVIGTARDPAAAKDLMELEVQIVQLDVTDQGSVDRLADELGDQPIDVLINNAGVLSMLRSIKDIDFDQFNRAMAVNAVGPIRVTQALLTNLQAGETRKIINISSIAGSITSKTSGGMYGYSESKAALNMFTRSLAGELGAAGFICIVIQPGWVQTDMGGSSAPVTVQESVAGIRDVVDKLTAADNGEFWTYDGQRLPW
jgi:NAD(P)-dependent dehydrogenase (short-subunit alcohol dehydrogenase family)